MATTPICTIEDIEAALGRTLTDEEAARAPSYIQRISSYVANYCDGIALGVREDEVVRKQADVYGIVDLGGGPVSVVTTVTAVTDSTEVSGWTFDGTALISGLDPYQTVDVTLDRGVVVPDDIRDVGVDALLGLIAVQAVGPLSRRTVGDVTHVYADPNQQSFTVVLSQSVLDSYRNQVWQMRVGDEWPDGRYYDDVQTGR